MTFYYTVVCVYKYTFYKDNMDKKEPKPTLFGFSPYVYKENMAEKSKEYIISAVLRRKPQTLLDINFINNAIAQRRA